ncbi:hypothetical protein Ahy_A02g006567 isoform C [Arachis hypogaea]|uniref:Uncharacterized protein n=1 Tax=Arachis hypogaea TaxID=3818 RepID=A0A445EAA4_ARAHY|nr:hypothetical protein Ahy_A02g006567 isoform C [Arachis hypogaea]
MSMWLPRCSPLISTTVVGEKLVSLIGRQFHYGVGHRLV